MKKLLLVVLAVFLMSAFAFAEGEAKGGQFGLQTGLTLTSTIPAVGFDIGAKYMISNNIAIRAALGLANQASGGASTTIYDLGAGFEYHFGGNKGGVSPYAGAQLNYSGESVSTGGSTPSEFTLSGILGGEYFFSNNFSWAGEARVGFDSSTAGGGATTTTIGILGFATFLTWYLN